MNRRNFLVLLGLTPFSKLVKTLEEKPTTPEYRGYASGTTQVWFSKNPMFDLSKIKRTYVKPHKTFDEKRFL